MQQLTYTPTENTSTNIQVNEQTIYDINTQRQELDKGMLIGNNIKDNLNSQQLKNTSWLVTTIKATLDTPIQKFKKPILLFRITHKAAVINSKILASFKGELGAAIVSHKNGPVNYES